MATITNNKQKIHENVRHLDRAPPNDYIITGGDIIIKNLSEKQLSKSANLSRELERTQRFEPSSSKYVSITQLVRGKTDSKTFNDCAEVLETVELLRSYGLTSDEIKFFRDYQKGLSGDSNDAIIGSIAQKIIDNEKTTDKPFDRHEAELELSVKPNSLETKLYKFALSCRQTKPDQTPQQHPIKHLPEIHDELFGHLNSNLLPKKITTLQKRLRKKAETIEELNVEQTVANYVQGKQIKRPGSLWDVKCVNESKKKLRTCERETPKNYYAQIKGEIVQVDRDEAVRMLEMGGSDEDDMLGGTICLEHIKRHRLTVDEIKALPQFSTYDPGVPNQVMFVKNLSKTTTERDLIRIFSNYDRDKPCRYRLLNGRMKGQAFITFPSVEIAQKALQDVNGYILNEKPIILQFGKRAS